MQNGINNKTFTWQFCLCEEIQALKDLLRVVDVVPEQRRRLHHMHNWQSHLEARARDKQTDKNTYYHV